MNIYPYKKDQDQSQYLARYSQPQQLSNNAYFTRQEPYEIQQQPFQFYGNPTYQNEPIEESVVVPSQQQMEREKISNLIGSSTEKNNTTSRGLKINWILYFFIIIFLIIIAVVSGGIYFQHYQKIQRPAEDLAILKRAIENLKAAPILDIYSLKKTSEHHHFNKHLERQIPDSAISLITQSEKEVVENLDQNQLDQQHCTHGYSAIEVGKFFGVQSGCVCEDGKVLHSVHCLVAGNKCKRVSEVEKRSLFLWGNNRLCVKTSMDWQYVGNQACLPEQRKCQRGLCISRHEQCPVSNLNKLNAGESAEEKLQLRDNFKLGRDEANQPVIGFTITPGVLEEAPCFNEELQPQFESKKYYPLANVPEKGCQDQMTGYKISLDSQLEKEVYEGNYLKDTLKTIPFWNELTRANTDHFHLQAIRRIKLGTHEDCDRLNPSNLEKSHNQGDQLYWSTKWVSILLLLNAVLGLFIALILYIFRNKMIGSLYVSAISQTKIIYWIAFIAAIIIVINGYVYVRNVEMKNGLRSQEKDFAKYIQQQCFFDAPIQKSFTSFTKFVQSVYSTTEVYMKTGLIAGVIFIVLSIIIALIQVFYYTEKVCQDPWK